MVRKDTGRDLRDLDFNPSQFPERQIREIRFRSGIPDSEIGFDDMRASEETVPSPEYMTPEYLEILMKDLRRALDAIDNASRRNRTSVAVGLQRSQEIVMIFATYLDKFPDRLEDIYTLASRHKVPKGMFTFLGF